MERRQQSTKEATFESFVEGHPELNDLQRTTRELGTRSLEFAPFGIDMTVDVTQAEMSSNDTQTNMGGHTDSCKDN